MLICNRYRALLSYFRFIAIAVGAGSSLKLSGTGSITNGGALHLAPGGTLDGTGVLTIHGQFEWQGGAMAGSGKTLFAPGSVIHVINGDNKTLRDRTVDNATTVQWNATHALSVGGGTVWNNLSGSVLDLKADASIQFWFGAGGVLNNHGTIRKSGGTGTSSIGYALHNSATVQASSGTINLTAGDGWRKLDCRHQCKHSLVEQYLH